MLAENGGEVGLGNIVGEGAVAEDTGRVASRGKLLVPGDDALCQRLDIIERDLFGKAGEQYAATDSIDLLACLLACLLASGSRRAHTGRGRV